MIDATKIDKRVKDLAGRTYSADEVIAACGITGDMLTNYLSKSGIELCSESPGRGRSRQFCLIDVYLIALLSRLGAKTRNVKWTASALNYLTFGPVFSAAMEEARTIAQPNGSFRRETTMSKAEVAARKDHRRGQLCADITRSHHAFWTRDYPELAGTFIAFADEMAIQTNGPLEIVTPDKAGHLISVSEGVYLNVTSTLRIVDAALIALIKEASK